MPTLGPPDIAEFAVWSGLAGVLFVLMLAAVVEMLRQRSSGSVRSLVFLLTIGLTSLSLSGWLEWVWLSDKPQLHQIIRIILPPCSAALALLYLGIWLQDALQDDLSHYLVVGTTLVCASTGVGLMVLIVSGMQSNDTLLMVSACVTLACAVVAVAVAARAWWLGDQLARWMSVACMILVIMVAGLFAITMRWLTGVQSALLVALSVVAYLTFVLVLAVIRNRQRLILRQQSRGQMRTRVDTQLPSGTQAIRAIEEAMWRSERASSACVVATVNITNLIGWSLDQEGHAEAHIMATLAARIRRVVGFRNVVGLVHSHCFVLAVSAVQDPRRGELLVNALQRSLVQPIPVWEEGGKVQFMPEVGIGVVNVHGQSEGAMYAVKQAEQLALRAWRAPKGVLREDFVPHAATRPAELGPSDQG
jgi:hypothetical protein